jgi:hypothetical protein
MTNMPAKTFYVPFVFMLLFAPLLRPQEFRATLRGRVTDSSNASVPGVKVELRNIETNVFNNVVTDNRGDYTILFLRPGTYSISGRAQGFKTFSRTGITLNVGQTAEVNIQLELGSLSEQITVTSEAPLLDAAKADRGTVVDNQRVTEFPLNGRNPMLLSTIIPGVNYNGAVIYMRPFDNGSLAQWSINGSGNNKTEYLLDGAPNNAQAGVNNVALVPQVDAVQEFKIQSNSYDAQYGHTGGGIMNISLKSGTNRPHGTVYEFARRDGWDANSFQNNAKRIKKSSHILDQYGFELDGPVYIPKLYNGKDKTFFMTGLERYREVNPATLMLSVPTPEMLNGDYSKLADTQGRPVTIFDPATGRDVKGVWTRDPFPGNIVPGGRINPIAKNILAYMPAPNIVTPGAAYSQNNYYVQGDASAQLDAFYNFTTKLDQNIGNQRFFFRHANNRRQLTRTDNGIIDAPGNRGYYPHTRRNVAEVLDWVDPVNPTTIFNVRVSFNRYLEGDQVGQNKGFDKTTLGFPSTVNTQIANNNFFGYYDFNDSYITLGQHPNVNETNNWSLHPTLTKIWSKHDIKTGIDMRTIQYASQNIGNPFWMSTDSVFTRRDYSRSDGLSGNPIAAFQLGTPSAGGSDNYITPIFMSKYFAPYVQDDWKVTKRLTINLGFRWDVNTPQRERFNRLNRGFDENWVNSTDKLVNRTLFPNLGTLKGRMLFAGVDGNPTAATDLYKNAIQPRIGFALRLSEKTVLRTGWGRYYVNPTNDYQQLYGYNQTTSMITSLDAKRTSLPNLLNDPFPAGVIQPAGSSKGDLTYIANSFSFVNPNFKLPHVNQFSFGFQRELPFNSKLDISYVGSRTVDGQSSKSINNVPLSLRNQCDPMLGGTPSICTTQVANPFYQIAPFYGTGAYTATKTSFQSTNMPYLPFGGLTELTDNDNATWYNSMQVSYEVRSRAGLNFIGSYTLSKMIERSGYNDVQQGIMNQGLSSWDRTHVLTLSAVWELPFGRGKRFLNTSNPFFSRILSGWENAWNFSYSSGRPQALPSNVIYVKEGEQPNIDWSKSRVSGWTPCVARFNDNGTITMQKYSTSAGCTDYNFLAYNTSYHPRQTPSYDGRLRIMAVPQANISLNKTTLIKEGMSVQFRAEAFNAFNTYWITESYFNNNPDSSLFGTLDKSTIGSRYTNAPRQVQFGLKFLF